jgi:hypothetical protein
MNDSTDIDGTLPRPRFHMETGLDVLEEWSEHATQSRKNAVYQALFAMLDGTLFQRYRTIDDFQRPSDLYVIVKNDLMIKIRVHCFDSFGIVYVGPTTEVVNQRGDDPDPERAA